MKRILFILLLFIPLGLSEQVISSTVSYATGPRTYLDVINDGNTKGWYIAEVGDLTKDGTDSVSVWADHLGSGRDLLAADNTPAQPVWSANGIQFNGVENYMRATFDYNQPEFLYIVCNWTVGETSESILDGLTTSYGRIYQSSSVLIAARAPTSSGNHSFTYGSLGIIRVLFNGASSKLIFNNATPTTWNCGANNMDAITIGCRGAIDYFAEVLVSEIIARKVSDIAGDEAILYNYLKNKYGL